MKLKGVLFLAGYTGRSQAYAQALANANIDPENVILFGEEKGKLPGQMEDVQTVDVSLNLFLPDFSESIKETCERRKWQFKDLISDQVNDQPIFDEVAEINPDLIIYSGYGSQLVGERILNLGAPFLHMHAGWLPDFRGSTTLYYSWLKENQCGVTAILLNSEIDKGAIIAKKKYPPPPEFVDPDYIYDSSIRADLLVDVMHRFANDGEFLIVEPQPTDGTTYYVIHPVLKHITRLRN